MAYSKTQIEQYKVNNARKTNSKKFPNGYIYILAIKEFDLYKVGVSQNPKRRVRDIKSYLPFESEVVFLRYYKDVYLLEQAIHERLKNNVKRKEWFQLYNEDVDILKSTLNQIFIQENN